MWIVFLPQTSQKPLKTWLYFLLVEILPSLTQQQPDLHQALSKVLVGPFCTGHASEAERLVQKK